MERIFLVGLMGSGKSSVGRKLASSLGYRFIDTDELIKEKYGEISTIFEELGETAFRSFETQCLQELLNEKSLVVATGGGLPVFNDNMRTMLENGTVVYLHAKVATLVKRLRRSNNNRPLLTENKEQVLNRMFDIRNPVYTQANFTLNTESSNIEQVVEQITALFAKN